MSAKHLRCVAVLLLAGLSLPAQAVVVSDGQGAFFSYRPTQATVKPQAPAHAPRWTYGSLRNKPQVAATETPTQRPRIGGLLRNPAVPAAIAGASAVEMVRQFNARANTGSTSLSPQDLNQLITWMTRGTGRDYGGARFADVLRKEGPSFSGLSAGQRAHLASIANRAKAVVEMKKRTNPALGGQAALLADSRFADMLLRVSGHNAEGGNDMRIAKPFVPRTPGTLMLKTGAKMSYGELRNRLTTGSLRESGGQAVASILERTGTDLVRMSAPEKAQLRAAISQLAAKHEVLAKSPPRMPEGYGLVKFAILQADMVNRQISLNQDTVRFLQNWIAN